MSYHVYHNPRAVSIGDTPIGGVESVAWRTVREEILATGDDDARASVVGYGPETVRGTIRFLDPDSAAAAAGKTGTLSLVLAGMQGGADKTVSVGNCALGGYEARVARGEASACTLPFVAGDAPVIS